MLSGVNSLSPILGRPKVGDIVFVDWIAEKLWCGEVVNPSSRMFLKDDEVAVKIDHNKQVWTFKISDLKVDKPIK